MGLFTKKEKTTPPPELPNDRQFFRFVSYYFDKESLSATFCYQGLDKTIFTERVAFAPNPEAGKKFNVTDDPALNSLLDRALFLAFIAIGTSYFKAHPTPYIYLDQPLDDFQVYYFNKIYQEGLSQFAFENQLTRAYLAHFYQSKDFSPLPSVRYKGNGILSLQSGGKDSLLTATMLSEQGLEYTPWYLSSSPDRAHPIVIDNLSPDPTKNLFASIAVRELDLYNLEQTGGMNGHVPVSLITESLALIQAILMNKNVVLTSIAQEASEPATTIGDLPVNHQWSKTWEAEQLLAEYVKRYISPDLIIGSPIRHLSEMRVAEQFVKKCWERYGYSFSSCNVANYRQLSNNSELAWCGNCAKCANIYLLFCPFLPPASLNALFHDEDLFLKESLTPIFKGLLGVEGTMKPFECVGSVDELRTAYHSRLEGHSALPFAVPEGNFDYRATYPVQDRVVNLFKK